jgi:hypothetical protein
MMTTAVTPAVASPLVTQNTQTLVCRLPGQLGFGNATAISGNTAVVGGCGSASVFSRTGGVWHLSARLKNPFDAGDNEFGASVAVSGDTIVVGAPGNPTLPGGVVFVYGRSNGRWSRQAKLTTPTPTSDDSFGSSVALTKDMIVVGDPFHDHFSGAVFAFVRFGSAWTSEADLVPTDGRSVIEFGLAVAAGPDVIAVGTGSVGGIGSGYVFSRSGPTWSQVYEHHGLTGSPAEAVSGSTVVLGGGGSATVVADESGVWTEEARLHGRAIASTDSFGSAVATDGVLIVVGDPTEARVGTAYVFVRSPIGWDLSSRIVGRDIHANDRFGSSVGIAGSEILIGVPGHFAGRRAAGGMEDVFAVALEDR